MIADTFHLDQSGQKVEKLKLADVGVKPMGGGGPGGGGGGPGGGGGGNINPPSVSNNLTAQERASALAAAISLSNAFPWGATREGAAFWTNIYDRLHHIGQGAPL
jgi:hypothetical protein